MQSSKFKNVTRCIILAFMITFMGLSDAAAQIVVKGQSMTPIQVIKLIEKTSSYSFFYNAKDLADIPAKAFDVSGSIDEVMDKVFSQTGISWKIQGNEIILKRDGNKLSRQTGSQKGRTVTGIVTDATDGTPIIGASVFFKGTKNGVITGNNGEYSLNVTENHAEIVVSSLGYRDKILYISDQGIVNVQLSPDSEVLGEVVVVAAGTQKKVSVTGAISAIEGDILSAPTSSLTNNLAGKLAGVISMTQSGQPGSTSQFYIRGISTFGGRTTPLILMDGVEISVNDLNNIPTESIESFSILKDASATAIYGARGANGVMLITTKNGSENTKARINVTLEESVLQPVNIIDYADGATYMRTYNEAQVGRTASATPRYSETQIKNTAAHVNKYLYPDVDWYDLMFKKYTTSQRGNINVSGGGSRVSYYMSLQMNHDNGILDVPKEYSFDNNYNRYLYTFQNNISYKVTPNTKIDLRMNAQIIKEKSPSTSASDIFNAIYMNTPVSFPALYPQEEGDTHLKFGSQVLSVSRFYTNPYANMLNTFKENNENKLNVSLNLNQNFDFITKGLSLTALVNFNNWSRTYFTRSLTPYLYNVQEGSWSEDDMSHFELNELQVGSEYISQSGVTRSSDNTFYLDSRVNWVRSFGKHNLGAMLMYMMREFRSDVLPNRNQGFSGRLTYDWAYTYLAEFNFGYNGTERLKENSRFEFFPAVSFGWVASNMDFWGPLKKQVDYFKIRGSYGLVGSDETGSYAGAPHFLYINSVNMSGGTGFASGYTGGTWKQGSIVTAYATQGAHWERAKELDLGIDLHLLDQITVAFDWYHNKRDRILMKRASFPSILGYGSAIPWSNIGKVDNKGIELSIKWTRQLTKDFMIDARFNYTYTKNKYVYVDEPDYPYVWQTSTGKPLSRMTGYIAEGLFKDPKEISESADQSNFGSTIMPGDIKYRDVNGDGSITSEDQVMLSPYGNIPRIQYGIGVSMVYKKLDFSVYFNGSGKRNVMINGIFPFCANDTNDRNLMKWIADSHWTEGADNSDVDYPRLGVLTTQILNNTQPSSFWMKKANFIRFKTLEIGYSFKYLRIYLNGDNIAVWSPFKYWDPELWYNSYPLSRTFNLGLQFKF